jgi:hypothetical protein
MKKKDFVRVVAMSDMHCGTLGGLTPPRYNLAPIENSNGLIKDASIFEWESNIRKKLWDWFSFQIELIKTTSPIIALIVNGDLVHGTREKISQDLLYPDIEDQQEMAASIIRFIDPKELCYVARGSLFHINNGGELEKQIIAIANLSAACKVQVMNKHTPNGEEKIIINNRVFSIQHRMGRANLNASRTRLLLKEEEYQVSQAYRYHKDWNELPKILIRSHTHQSEYYASRAGLNKMHLINTPALCAPIGIGGRIWKPGIYEVGFFVIDLPNNKDAEPIVSEILCHEIMSECETPVNEYCKKS